MLSVHNYNTQNSSYSYKKSPAIEQKQKNVFAVLNDKFENSQKTQQNLSFGRKVRLLITEACSRRCKGCCNTYNEIMQQGKKAKLGEITGYDKIMITGGEPAEDSRLKDIVNKLRTQNPNGKLYLYSARVNDNLLSTIPKVDGLHFSLHEGATEKDIQDFEKLQQVLLKSRPSAQSFRLYLDPRIDRPVSVVPSLYSRIESKKWLTEKELLDNSSNKGLPAGEELVFLAKD